MNNNRRTPDFERNEAQDSLLRRLNRALATAEDTLDLPSKPSRPMVMIVGAPRSGTTLLLQWLASSGYFGYPSNLIARFYGAPSIGAQIQQLLFDPMLDYRHELSLSPARASWASTFGKTTGALEPHEFFYFWRRFFPVDQGCKLAPEQLAASDPLGFIAGWARLESVLNKPIVSEALLLQYDIELLASWLPTAIFLHIRRNETHNAHSLLRARRAVFGDETAWFSVKPPGFHELLSRDPMEQVLGQIRLTNKAIAKSFEALPETRQLAIQYEDFCDHPEAIWTRIGAALSTSGERLPTYGGPASFIRSSSGFVE